MLKTHNLSPRPPPPNPLLRSIFMAMNYLHKNEISMVRSLTMERILIGRAGYIKVGEKRERRGVRVVA